MKEAKRSLFPANSLKQDFTSSVSMKISPEAILHILDLVNRHAEWIAFRQSVAAQNIANADTPGFKARTAADFTVDTTAPSVPLLRTDPKHQNVQETSDASFSAKQNRTTDPTLSGNTVELNKELLVIGENTRMRSFDASAGKSFHRMLLSSLKV